jgi:Raf kinase inhibitor-like protein, YbhB/YbcL family
MKKIIIILALLVLSGCTAASTKPITVAKNYTASSTPLISNQIYMTLRSPDFSNGNSLPIDFTCFGKGKAPVLQIDGAPATTTSFALIVNDPDAPGAVYTHWLAWNFDRATTTIDAKNPPKSVTAGTNSSGSAKYVAPCPPSGTHHYYFRLYALNAKLNLPTSADQKQLLSAMKDHIIDEAVLMGLVQH